VQENTDDLQQSIKKFNKENEVQKFTKDIQARIRDNKTKVVEPTGFMADFREVFNHKGYELAKPDKNGRQVIEQLQE
jgi:uncharacterized protein YeeX (DUF496 family)